MQIHKQQLKQKVKYLSDDKKVTAKARIWFKSDIQLVFINFIWNDTYAVDTYLLTNPRRQQ